MSGKMEEMKSIPWPTAVVVTVALIIIGVLAAMERDINGVVAAIIVVISAFGYGELREIKSNTNGTQAKLLETNQSLLAELAEYRRSNAENFQTALGNPAVSTLSSVPTAIQQVEQDQVAA